MGLERRSLGHGRNRYGREYARPARDSFKRGSFKCGSFERNAFKDDNTLSMGNMNYISCDLKYPPTFVLISGGGGNDLVSLEDFQRLGN